MTNTKDGSAPRAAAGLVLHRAAAYDLLVGLMTLGRERAFRERLLDRVRLEPGAAVLDVGCGTGSLAIAAKRRVGPDGAVTGIDASPEMLARAVNKARKAGTAVRFEEAPAQALPFPAARFDAVLSTVMFHHLPRTSREQCAREMKRVLKPGGRAFIVDFAAPAQRRHSPLDHIHRRHGHVSLDDVAATIEKAGLVVAERGPIGYRNLHFVLATKPRDA